MDVYAVFGGFVYRHVYRSTNGGANWQDISGNLPDIPHQTVCIDPQFPQNIYVGNDLLACMYQLTAAQTGLYSVRECRMH